MGTADIHIHTTLSDGMGSVAQALEYIAANPGLDVVAITDHDDITGGLMAKDMAQKMGYPFEVVVGAEITTLEGHLLALFLTSPVPNLRSLSQTIKAIHAQNGICIAPHPMSWFTHSIGQRSLENIFSSVDPDVYFDGIEVVNASPAGHITEAKVKKLNGDRYHLPELGSSDAHFIQSIGMGVTVFQGSSAEELKDSIISGTTSAAGSYLGLSDIGWTNLIRQQFRSLVLTPTRGLRRPLHKLLRGW